MIPAWRAPDPALSTPGVVCGPLCLMVLALHHACVALNYVSECLKSQKASPCNLSLGQHAWTGILSDAACAAVLCICRGEAKGALSKHSFFKGALQLPVLLILV